MTLRDDTAQARSVANLPVKVSRYRILQRIGKGAMGVVYAARDDRMPRDVAVKVMLADLEGEPEIRARFFREAQLAGRLVHRNIVTIFDTGEDEGRLFIVMELLRGQTLADYLKESDVPLERKLDIMIQICEGLSIASAAGIFHRDVKPGNLFVQHDGSLKILDFGIARLASSNMTASGFIVGTPDYMAPEQARGQEVDQRSDVFSSGAVFYFMLSGRKPFAAHDLPAVLHKVISEDPLPLRETEAPPALGRIISRMLAKDPVLRYQGFRDVLTDLVRVSKKYDADTRAKAQAALTVCESIEALSQEESICAAALGVPVLAAGPSPCQALQEIASDYPQFAERGLTGLKTVRVSRGVVDAVRFRLDVVHADIEERARLVREALRHVEAARARREAGDFAGALADFDAAARLVPASEAMLEESGRCRHEAANRQAEDERLAALLAQSADSRALGRVDAALAFAEEAMALRPDHVPATKAVSALREAVSRAADERRRAAERHVERVRRASAKGQFADAERELSLLGASGADSGLVEQLTIELRDLQRAREAEDERSRVASQAVAAAWSAVRAGGGDAEIALVEALPQSAHASIRRELVGLRAERTRLADQARRQAQAATAIETAEAASNRGDVADALRWAEKALDLSPDDRRAKHIAGAARVALREQALRQTRLDRAASHVDAAKAELARGRFDRAIREAEWGAELNPELEAPAALIAQALKGKEDADAAKARELAAVQRRRAARSTLAAARAALQTKNFVLARWAAENALAIDPASAEAREVIRLATAAAASVAADETVDLSPDSENTASLQIASPLHGAAHYFSLVRERVQMVRVGASRAIARLRSTRGETALAFVIFTGLVWVLILELARMAG